MKMIMMVSLQRALLLYIFTNLHSNRSQNDLIVRFSLSEL